MNKYWQHFKLITKHKWYVYKACVKAGIRWRGIMHDMSKYSPIEFLEYGKYFTGKGSPVDECKRVNGMCAAWQHHKGHNPHHWEHWVDRLSDGGVGTIMPYKYAVELLCDYVGAGQAYEKDKWCFDRPYDYWVLQRKSRAKIHPAIVDFIDSIFWTMKEQQTYDALDKEYTKNVYDRCIKEFKESQS